MSDRRSLWSNGRVAHSSLLGRSEADVYTDGTLHQVSRPPLAAICGAPFGERDRELLWGQCFNVLEVSDGWAFGYTLYDGYAGYIEEQNLEPSKSPATHRISVRQTMALTEPDFKATRAKQIPLSLGSEVRVKGSDGTWATLNGAPHALYVPSRHLTPLDRRATDPVSVAELLLGTPYVWGGNSAFGIDCSGLVQIACKACGLPCPGDSDQQMAQLGETLDPGTPAKRGDLLFWKGHVGWVSDPDTLLHANAHSMSVTYEPLAKAIERIAAQGDPILRHARLTPH
ncbi:NlpC/P60 family protein [Marivita sp. XM-24bin2]|jgi:cell wall-associated NlpC family hydrolase|uniref:C40 family peptidase n=1 Tax=unclassified Marivita TaxID=2632480 RepID=UPI000D7979D2|nr:NlpC/P60 family protein [Marivita sp. XM-24bin2]MCR9108340.1 NlpC/P60 family protein [Paracoccaceae bacterium]PWL36297.1 MAG: NLP/P60 hydrolase [Marivita sp. XM-24bin2]